jgi:hypothetical protein
VNHHFGHALERLRERWLPEATPEDCLAVEEAIRAGRALRLRSEDGVSKDRALYVVPLGGIKVLAIYAEKDGALVTFPPPEELHRLPSAVGYKRKARRR